MRHNSPNANYSQRRANLSSSAPSLDDEEISFILTLQDILSGKVTSVAEIPREVGRLHLFAYRLLLEHNKAGVPQFWRQYEALATCYTFLRDWKDFVANISAASGQQTASNSSAALEQQAVSPQAPNEQGDEPGILVSRVRRQRVDWFWKSMVPLGKLTLLDGDPGTGKSLLLCDLAARLSRGLTMPDGTAGLRAGVVIIAPEDDLSDTIQPRLERAGADLSQIVCLNEIEEKESDGTISERPFLLTQDLEKLEAAIGRVQAKLVILSAWEERDQQRWRGARVACAIAAPDSEDAGGLHHGAPSEEKGQRERALSRHWLDCLHGPGTLRPARRP